MRDGRGRKHAPPWVANSGQLALLRGFVFLGEDEGQLSISLCKLRNYMPPSDSACASGLCGTSWDVSPCALVQLLQNGDSS